MARQAKTYIKDGRVTRTVTFTLAHVVSIDRKTRSVKDDDIRIEMEYTSEELEKALPELGYAGGFVEGQVTYETELREMTARDFIKHSKKVENVPPYEKDVND